MIYENLDDNDDEVESLTQEALEELLKTKFESIECCNTKYHWCAISHYRDGNSTMIYGTSFMSGKPTEVTLRSKFLSVAAQAANDIGVTWDPFNQELLVKCVKGSGAL